MKIQLSRFTNSVSTPEALERLEKVLMLPATARTALNVVFIYEDADSREWARNINERVCQLVGSHPVRPTWWKLSNLCEPGVLAAAVSTTMRADVIVLAVKTEEGLPLPFYAWVNNWLPHRLQGSGLLIALLGSSVEPTSRSGRIGDYLRAVAKQANLTFLLAQGASERAVATTSVVRNGKTNGHELNGYLRNGQRNHAVAVNR